MNVGSLWLLHRHPDLLFFNQNPSWDYAMSPSYGQRPHHHHQLVWESHPFPSPERDSLKDCSDPPRMSPTEPTHQFHLLPSDLMPDSGPKFHGHWHPESFPSQKEPLPLKLPLLHLQTTELFHKEPPSWGNSHPPCSQPWKDQNNYNNTHHHTHWVRPWEIHERVGRKRKEIHWVVATPPISCGSWRKRQSVFLEQEVVTTSSSLVIASVLVANQSERAIQFPICLRHRARTVVTTALVDCGATGNFINPSLVVASFSPCDQYHLSKPWVSMVLQTSKDKSPLQLKSIAKLPPSRRTCPSWLSG